MAGHIVATVLGLAGLAGTWLAWTGRRRAPGASVITPNWAWTVLPSVSLIAISYTVHPLAYVALPVAVLSLVMALWGPDWYGPRWWRERDRGDIDLTAPDNAYLYAAMGPGLG